MNRDISDAVVVALPAVRRYTSPVAPAQAPADAAATVSP